MGGSTCLHRDSREPQGSRERQALRAQTLERLGEAALNAGPLMTVLRAPADDPEAVVEAVQQCPTLTSRLLSVVNAAAFGCTHPIDSVRRAVVLLGAGRARAIVLAFGLRLLADGSKTPLRLVNRLWGASLHKAMAARLAAQVLQPTRAENAFCLALVQDVGLPLLVGLDPAFYENLVPGSRGSWSEQEIQHFGLDHAEAGYHLLKRWGAAAQLSQAVLHHHRPPTSQPGKEVLAQVPQFIASLLPHLDEEPTGQERDWLTLLYARFLSGAYGSLESFLRAASERAVALHHSADAEPPQVFLSSLMETVANDAASMVVRLCRLETALGRQREDLDALRFQAFTDPLTRVLNRRGFTQFAQRRIEEVARRRLGACCIVVDIDNFKAVNDQFGHEGGDQILRGVARLLRRHLDRSDLLGRLGGDE
ncbi:MAG TPA: HDOD domain-containing protein, partial [Phycisphaeraceae bacterium]